VSGKNKMGNCLSCSSFVCADETPIILETSRIDGEFTMLNIGGDIFYCTEEEVQAIYEILLGTGFQKK
jgi:hypothetical protein